MEREEEGPTSWRCECRGSSGVVVFSDDEAEKNGTCRGPVFPMREDSFLALFFVSTNAPFFFVVVDAPPPHDGDGGEERGEIATSSSSSSCSPLRGRPLVGRGTVVGPLPASNATSSGKEGNDTPFPPSAVDPGKNVGDSPPGHDMPIAGTLTPVMSSTARNN